MASVTTERNQKRNATKNVVIRYDDESNCDNKNKNNNNNNDKK